MRGKVVVVGDTGLVGRPVCEALVRRDIAFTGVSRTAADVSWPHRTLPADGDYAGLLADSSCVFVCAGPDGGSDYKKRHAHRLLIDTIQSFSSILGALPTDRPCRVIVCSSIKAAAAGEGRDNVYGMTKKIVEDMIAALNLASDSLEIAAVRLCPVFGCPDWTGLRHGRLIPTWTMQILGGREPELTGRAGAGVELVWNGDIGDWLVELSRAPNGLPTTIEVPEDLKIRLSLEELAGIMKRVCAHHLGAIDIELDLFERRLLDVVRWVDATQAIARPEEARLGV